MKSTFPNKDKKMRTVHGKEVWKRGWMGKGLERVLKHEGGIGAQTHEQ